MPGMAQQLPMATCLARRHHSSTLSWEDISSCLLRHAVMCDSVSAACYNGAAADAALAALLCADCGHVVLRWHVAPMLPVPPLGEDWHSLLRSFSAAGVGCQQALRAMCVVMEHTLCCVHMGCSWCLWPNLWHHAVVQNQAAHGHT
jgi:hypothetical protein